MANPGERGGRRGSGPERGSPATASRGAAPLDEGDLLRRARDLEGVTLGEIARTLGVELSRAGLRSKGKAGELIERALGARGGAGAKVDFPELGVELKTIPTGATGRPRESTFVCTFPLADADRATWSSSWVKRKLACVLWVPLAFPAAEGPADEGEARAASPRVGRVVLWRPTPPQEAVLAADFEEIVGLVGAGRVDELTARAGRWLQVRPKAAHGRARTLAFGPESEPTVALPRGFYLRARFTGAILADPSAVPE